jgi:hypothetical protein
MVLGIVSKNYFMKNLTNLIFKIVIIPVVRVFINIEKMGGS